jgi:hypothetical protein
MPDPLDYATPKKGRGAWRTLGSAVAVLLIIVLLFVAVPTAFAVFIRLCGFGAGRSDH